MQNSSEAEYRTWTIRTSAADNAWGSVTFGGGLFVAVSVDGSGDGVMTSPDGMSWTIRASAADNMWQSVTFGNGGFVATASFAPVSGDRVMTSGLSGSSSVTDAATIPAVPDVMQAVGRPATGCATYVSTGSVNKGNVAGTGWNPSWGT